MYRRRNDSESLDDRLDAIERQSTRRNPRNLEWRRAPDRQTEHNSSGEEPDEPNDCIITIENEDQRNVGMRKKNSSLSNDYSRPTKKNTTRNERHVSFDLRGSPRSIGLFEDVDVGDFEESEFGSHHQFERDFNIGVRNQDIPNTRTFNAGCQELEPNVQIRRKMIARKQREHSDDEDDDDLCNNMDQSMRRNTYQTTEKNTHLGREKADESISRDRGTRTRLMEGNTNFKSWTDSVPRTTARRSNSMEGETDSFSKQIRKQIVLC